MDWQDFRIWRLHSGALRVVYRAGPGLLPDDIISPSEGEEIRARVIETGDAIVVTDAPRDGRVRNPRAVARSIALLPLRFGDRLVGLLELEHHKRATYGDKDFRLGLNAAQTTLGALGTLTGATIRR